MRAIEFDPMGELIEKYGNLRSLEDIPRDNITRTAAIFRPSNQRKQIVPWDGNSALELWRERESHEGKPLPYAFNTISEVTEAPVDLIGRNMLVLKARNCKDLTCFTTDNE
jgi:anaerobic dimethyl sulfoxide reductase subunit B (iron-sulfur subunit)